MTTTTPREPVEGIETVLERAVTAREPWTRRDSNGRAWYLHDVADSIDRISGP